MSTKNSLFLTQDNEHCYSDCSEPVHDKAGNWIGDNIILEMDKRNAELICNDNDIIVRIFAGTELHKMIERTNDDYNYVMRNKIHSLLEELKGLDRFLLADYEDGEILELEREFVAQEDIEELIKKYS